MRDLTRRIRVPASRVEMVAAAAYLLFFAVGSLGHYIDSTRATILMLTPYVLLLAGLSALIPLFLSRAWNQLLWIAGTYVVTFALEAIGVATGVIFGQYQYGATLGLKMLQVPLIIGFNWAIVVLGSVRIAVWIMSRVSRPALTDTGHGSGGAPSVPVIILGSVIVGFLCLVFDLVLEPVAMRLDYWQWSTGIVPIRNYVAWFVIAATASVPGFMLRGIRSSRLPAYYIVVQFLFIASLLPA